MGLKHLQSHLELFDFQAQLFARCYVQTNNLLVADVGLGKQQPIDEPVLTPSGWVPIGDLTPGDDVYGANGLPTRVTSVHPQGVRECYRITFSDGSWTRCGPDHLWTVGYRTPGGRAASDTITLRQMLTTGLTLDHNGQKRYWIEVADPVQFPSQWPLQIDPYSLGAILGDGHIHPDGHVTVTSEIGILSAICPYRVPLKHRSDGIGVLNTSAFKSDINRIGAAGCRAWEKVVPDSLLMVDEVSRRRLLAGLLDTDGSPTVHGGVVEFTSTSESMINAVRFLAESLGGTSTRTESRVTHYTYAGERRAGRESYRIRIKTNFNPFIHSVKASRWLPINQRPPRRHVVAINRIDDCDQVCIRVSNSDGLYLTRSFIVTHNTVVSLALIAALFEDAQIDRVVLVVEKNKVAEWMADFERFTEGLTAAKVHGGKRTIPEGAQALVTTYHTARADIGAPEAPGPLLRALQGQRVLVIYDECSVLATSRTSAVHQAHRRLLESLPRRRTLGLSATPMTVSPENYFNIVNLFEPSLSGTEQEFYRDHVVRLNSFSGKPVAFKDEDVLARKYAPILLRKRKTDPDVIAQFPSEVEKVVPVELSKKEWAVYDGLRKKLGEIGGRKAQSGFRSLQSVACHPGSLRGSESEVVLEFLDEHPDAPNVSSTKSEIVLDDVESILAGGGNIILFCHAVRPLQALAIDCDARGIPYGAYHGGQSDAKNRDDKERFRSGEIRLILASSKMERGVNMPEASWIINYDTPTTHSSFLQRKGRGSRIDGGGGTLHIRTYMAVGTVEDGGAFRLWNKRQRQMDTIQDSDAGNEHISWEDRLRMAQEARRAMRT